MQQCEQLRKYNRWRRGDKRLKMPDPKELGELIDGVADRLEVLELERAEFFERWHGERRKREKLAHDVERCYRMLLSVPDTKGALFKAENRLREALAEQKVGAGGTAFHIHEAPIGEGGGTAPSAGTAAPEGHNDKAQGGEPAGEASLGATGSAASVTTKKGLSNERHKRNCKDD